MKNKNQVYSFAIHPPARRNPNPNACTDCIPATQNKSSISGCCLFVGLTHLLLPLNQLSDSLLDNLPPIQRFPYLMRSLVHDIPIVQVLGQMSKVSLLALPLAVGPDLNGRANNDERNIRCLNGPARGNVPLRQGISHQTLLQSGKYLLPSLVRCSPIHSVLTRAAVEEGPGDAVEAERRYDSSQPEGEASPGSSNAVKEILVQRVYQDKSLDLLAVSRGEHTRVDGPNASAGEDPRPRLTGTGECFAQSLCRLAGRERRRRRVALEYCQLWSVLHACANVGLPMRTRADLRSSIC